MKKRRLLAVLICLVSMLTTAGLAGCIGNGSLEGKVIDADGRPMSGVTVRAENGKQTVSVKLETDESGNYSFRNIPAGEWEVEFYDIGMFLLGTEKATVKNREMTRLDFTIGVKSASVNSNQPARGWLVGEHFYYGQDCIWGDTLAVLEYEYQGDKKVGQYLSTFDLKSREKQRVLQIPEDRMAGAPSIYQNKIVWDSIDREEFFKYAVLSSLPPPPNYDIFLLDLETSEVTQLTTEEHAQRSPRIYANTVVWLDARNQIREQFPFPFDVYALDLRTGQEQRITENPTVEGYHQIALDGNTIVWSDNRHADMAVASQACDGSLYNQEIYAYDLDSGEERRLTSSLRKDLYPDISGNIVTWLRQGDGSQADIFACDLASGMEIPVSTSGYAAFSPSISGSRIVWTDARSSKGNIDNDVVINGQGPGSDIYLYDLKTRTETRLTATEEWKVWQSPVMADNYLVYEWNRQVGPLVYITDLQSLTDLNRSVTENHTLIPVKDLDLFQVDQERPDDILPAPGLGPAYRANVHQQGTDNPWPSIVVSEAVFYGMDGVDETRVSYRKQIDTAAGETRNNIIKAVIPGEDVEFLRLYVDNVPQGIVLTDGMQWSGPFARASVLVIEVAQDVIPGEYPLEIGLLINGKDYGTITCTVKVQEEKS